MSKKSKRRRQRKAEIENQKKKLRQELQSLENTFEKVRRQNVKNSRIRKVKIFSSICNLMLPFILVAGVSTGVVKLLDGGLPVKKDDVYKYKRYSLEYQSDGLIEAEEYYQTRFSYSNGEIPDNELKIYSPWQLNNKGEYFRMIYTSDEEQLYDHIGVDLYTAVLEQDINYLLENIDEFDVEEEVSSIEQEINGEYIVESKLNFFVESDFIKVEESELKNKIVSISEPVFSLVVGVIINRLRKFKLKNSIEEIKKSYNEISTKHLETQINEVQNKILSLTKGGKNNAK